MTANDDWSPDDSSGDQPFEQGDEALDDSTGLDPDFLEAVEADPSLDPTLAVDDRELAEAGAELDDPESLAVLDGGIDDPDGIEVPPAGRVGGAADDEGWDLDAPVTRGDIE
jgi:hypothetical protein